MLKITKVKDAGWYSIRELNVNSASEITLSKIVDTVRKNANGKVAKITNGRITDDRDNIISFQVLVQSNGDFTWKEMPVMVSLYLAVSRNMKRGDEVTYYKEKSAIRQKLKTFTNKTIYEDKTIRTDSVKDEYDNADLQFLIDDEIEAINSYKKVIEKTDNPKLLALLSHILKEETKHVEELRAAQAGKFKIDD